MGRVNFFFVFVKIFAILLAMTQFSCGRPRLSERETRREQIRINAETKKRELSAIAGDYAGPLDQDNGGRSIQNATLHLEVIETPFNDNGGIDPVMMPQISGFLKFPYGASENAQEFLGFAIQSGEFDPGRSSLNLVVKHEQYGELQMTLTSQGDGFIGHWQALGLSMAGSMHLQKQIPGTSVTNPNAGSTDGKNNDDLSTLTGSYFGFADDDTRGIYYGTTLQIRSLHIPGKGFTLSADMKITRGDEGREFTIWKFEPAEFNPISRRITLKKDGVSETFVFNLVDGNLNGEWTSASLGRIGSITLSKKTPYATSKLSKARERTGRYDLCLNNFGTAHLPKQASLSLTVTPSASLEGKINAQSTMVFYLGDYDSEDRFTCSMDNVELDYLSGRFQGVCKSLANVEPLTITGTFAEQSFTGRLTASGGSGADLKSGRCQGDHQP